MTDRSGTLERVGPPVAQPQPPGAVAFRQMGVLKAFIPWAVVIAIWEIAAANGWSGAVLFPPPSSFLRYAIESDFGYIRLWRCGAPTTLQAQRAALVGLGTAGPLARRPPHGP